MISVVITTYGEEHWRDLAWSRAYPSAKEQEPAEIIVHHAPELEIGPARNEAAAKATQPWLLFLDADDELEPGYLEAMQKAVNTTVRANSKLFQPAVRYIRKNRPQAAHLIPQKDLRSDNFLVIGTLVSAVMFRNVRGFNNYPHGFEDWSLWAKCWKAGATIIPVPDAIYAAHINPRSKHRLMWRDRKNQVETHIRIQAELFPETV